MQRLNAFLHSLFGQITLLCLLVIAVLGAVLIALSQRTTQQAELAALQGINRSTAMYITQQAPLMDANGLDDARLTELADRAMVINPALEIYVTDPQGRILAHRFAPDTVQLQQINILAVERFLAGAPLPIQGDDPQRPGEAAVFSASPITDDENLYGYVYAVVGGQVYQAMKAQAQAQHHQNLYLSLAATAVLGALLVAALLAFALTRPLARLRQEIQAYQPGEATIAEAQGRFGEEGAGHEIRQLRTSFRDMQNTVARQLKAIRQLDQTRRELIANVSHDLRTPLAALQGTLELSLLNADQISREQQGANIRSAYQQGKRLTRLVGDLFDLATLESGGLKPEPERFSLCELLQDCSQDLGQLARQRGVTLKLAMPQQLLGSDQNQGAFVVADISLIQRVLENLISNAIRHTPAGGEVTLRVESTEHGSRVAVADTGVGISSAELPHIFDRFYQAKDTQHSSQIGSGLGLAIVKRILAIHNTDIKVRSELNMGTCFEFELGRA